MKLLYAANPEAETVRQLVYSKMEATGYKTEMPNQTWGTDPMKHCHGGTLDWPC